MICQTCGKECHEEINGYCHCMDCIEEQRLAAKESVKKMMKGIKRADMQKEVPFYNNTDIKG